MRPFGSLIQFSGIVKWSRGRHQLVGSEEEGRNEELTERKRMRNTKKRERERSFMLRVLCNIYYYRL